jgi:1,4-dihydroxy-2-naphthoate octaprenyltransferase
MLDLRPWIEAGRPERAMLAPLVVAVGSSYAHFDEQPGPGLPAHLLVTLAAFAAGFGVNLIDHAWDRMDAPDAMRDSLIAAFAALGIAALLGLALVPLSGSAAVGYGLVAVLIGALRRAPVVGFDGLGWGVGDLATLVALGPLASMVGFASQAGTGSMGAILAGVPAGVIAASVLFARHFIEKDGDARFARVTPVAALGEDRARSVLVALPLVAAAAVVIGSRAGEYGAWSGLAAIPLGVAAALAFRLPAHATRDDYQTWERRALACAAAALIVHIIALRLASPD